MKINVYAGAESAMDVRTGNGLKFDDPDTSAVTYSNWRARVPTSHPQVRRLAHAPRPFPPPSCWNWLLPVIVGWCTLSGLMSELSINWIYWLAELFASSGLLQAHAAESQTDEIYTWLASVEITTADSDSKHKFNWLTSYEWAVYFMLRYNRLRKRLTDSIWR